MTNSKKKVEGTQEEAGHEPEKVSETQIGIVVFENKPLSPRLDIALSEIRNIMKREDLFLCCLRADDKIYFIPQGANAV